MVTAFLQTKVFFLGVPHDMWLIVIILFLFLSSVSSLTRPAEPRAAAQPIFVETYFASTGFHDSHSLLCF